MPRVHTVEKARKNYPEYGIKKGDKYYWWKFRYGGKRMSKTYPKQSELTQSAYLSAIYDLQDRINGISANTPEDLTADRDDIVSELETLRDETQDRLDSMPEHLQDTSSSGDLLRERIDALENAISELEGVDLDYDGPDENELREEALEELGYDGEDEDELPDGWEGEVKDKMADLEDAKLQEWLEEKFEEIQNISLE